MKKIPAAKIDEILAQTDIVGLIGQHVDLQKSGSEFKACCPFHEEKTPSFFVNPNKQFFHCFGCSTSGNAITFLRKKLNLDFPNAVRQLAEIAGVEIPELTGADDIGGEFAEMYQVMADAASIYQSALTSAAASAARDYIETRAFPARIVEKFGLGYAPDNWDFILKRLGKSNEQRELLQQVGLVTTSVNGGNRQYDRFRGRLMFPITDRRGRIVGFGGRVIDEEDEPKYLNSPETPLFKKGLELFGMHQSIGAIRNANHVLLVEGYTDVLALAAHGIENAVASLGTATTAEQLQMLFSATPEVVFCYDGDAAGARAGFRTLETVLPLMEDGRIASFVFLPEGQDPDTFIRTKGGEAFDRYIADNAMPFDLLMLRDLIDRNRSIATVAKALLDLRPRVQAVPGEILKELMVGRISTETKLPHKFVRRQLLLD